MTYQRPRAPIPGPEPAYPWRFSMGDNLYLYTHQIEEHTFKVVGGELHDGMPHYHVLAPDGHVWVMAQLLMTSRILPKR